MMYDDCTEFPRQVSANSIRNARSQANITCTILCSQLYIFIMVRIRCYSIHTGRAKKVASLKSLADNSQMLTVYNNVCHVLFQY